MMLPEQPMPQPPQFVAAEQTSTQSLPQHSSTGGLPVTPPAVGHADPPAPQRHVPPKQASCWPCTIGHTVPQPPQFMGSSIVFLQPCAQHDSLLVQARATPASAPPPHRQVEFMHT